MRIFGRIFETRKQRNQALVTAAAQALLAQPGSFYASAVAKAAGVPVETAQTTLTDLVSEGSAQAFVQVVSPCCNETVTGSYRIGVPARGIDGDQLPQTSRCSCGNEFVVRSEHMFVFFTRTAQPRRGRSLAAA